MGGVWDNLGLVEEVLGCKGGGVILVFCVVLGLDLGGWFEWCGKDRVGCVCGGFICGERFAWSEKGK